MYENIKLEKLENNIWCLVHNNGECIQLSAHLSSEQLQKIDDREITKPFEVISLLRQAGDLPEEYKNLIGKWERENRNNI